MIELIAACIVIVFLMFLIVFKEVIHIREKDRMMEKMLLLSDERAFHSYSQSEITKKSIDKRPQKKEQQVKFQA